MKPRAAATTFSEDRQGASAPFLFMEYMLAFAIGFLIGYFLISLVLPN
jgi:hypothetical protein